MFGSYKYVKIKEFFKIRIDPFIGFSDFEKQVEKIGGIDRGDVDGIINIMNVIFGFPKIIRYEIERGVIHINIHMNSRDMNFWVDIGDIDGDENLIRKLYDNFLPSSLSRSYYGFLTMREVYSIYMEMKRIMNSDGFICKYVMDS